MVTIFRGGDSLMKLNLNVHKFFLKNALHMATSHEGPDSIKTKLVGITLHTKDYGDHTKSLSGHAFYAVMYEKRPTLLPLTSISNKAIIN